MRYSCSFSFSLLVFRILQQLHCCRWVCRLLRQTVSQLNMSDDSLCLNYSLYLSYCVRGKMCLFALVSLIKTANQDMSWHSLCVCIHVLLIKNQGPPCSAISLRYSGQPRSAEQGHGGGGGGAPGHPSCTRNYHQREVIYILHIFSCPKP